MPSLSRQFGRPVAFLREEWRLLTTINRSDRPWQMPLAAALASGLPLLIAAAMGDIRAGLIASLGGLVFLYVPETPMHHRMATAMACAFAMMSSYAMGVLSHFVPVLMVPTLTFTAILATVTSRYFGMLRPGSFFFVLVAAVGAYSTTDLAGVPRDVGLLAMGTMLACLIAFLYSLFVLRHRAARPVPDRPVATFEFILLEPILIGATVGLSLLLAQLFRLDKPYWVPVSCLAVLQGATLRAVWTRQLHRILGTVLGIGLTWILFLLPLNPWGISIAVMALTFVVETAVVRNYAFAAIFITPLTILLADAAAVQHAAWPLIEARLVDTLLGCLVGLFGGVAIHSTRFRRAFSPRLRRLVPERFDTSR